MTDKSEDQKPVREPARPADRAEATATERRRRKTGVAGDGIRTRMVIPEELLDHANYVYRWANDERNRIHQLTVEDDYELVTTDGKAATTGDNTVVRYQAGTKPDGSPMYAYALRKKKVFYEEDQADKIAGVNAREKARLTEVPGDGPDKSYTPKG